MKIVEVVAALIVHEGKLLATQRGYGDFEGGWEFPGGKVEAGESPEAALVREINEELNARIGIDSFLMTVDYDYPTFHLTMRNYVCHLESESFELLEHKAAKWLAEDELDSVDWLPADVEIIQTIREQGVLK